MAEYLIQDTTLDAIADAINAKMGGSSAMTPAEMVTEIGSISGGGGESYPYIEHYQYVQAETKDYYSGGFTSWFSSTYLNKGQGVYWGKITDTTENASQYKAVAFYAIIESSRAGAFKRPINWIEQIGLETSFYVYAGGIIDLWFIPKTYFDT